MPQAQMIEQLNPNIMRLTYNIEPMYSDKSVNELVEKLNSIKGINSDITRTGVMKRELRIGIVDIAPLNNKPITYDDILSIGIMIGVHLTVDRV